MITGPERWTKLWREIGAHKEGLTVYQELVSLYSEPHRHYHNLNHIAECLHEFDAAHNIARHPVAIELAIWFHDAIYDPRASDNEEKSAELAESRLTEAGGDKDLCASVAALVMATKAHGRSAHGSASLISDLDLSVFGKPEPRFWEYEAQIRKEYDWVPIEIFAAKRAEILDKFLARGRIYLTQQFFDRYEKQARTNLHASVQRLTNFT
jgi:predicted metal-dependent HD superfamily phosphohydrolase